MKELKINPEFEGLLPSLGKEEFNKLKKEIESDGIRDSIVTWNDTIVDGHHRYKIAQELKIEYPVFEKTFKDDVEAQAWMVDNQESRRNITKEELSEIRAKVYLSQKKKVGANQHTKKEVNSGGAKVTPPQKTQEKVAKEFGVSPRTIMRDVKKYTTKQSSMKPKTFTEESQEGKILSFVLEKNGATKTEVAEHFKLKENSAGRALTNLSNAFKLERSKEKRGGKFSVYIPYKEKEVTLDVPEEELKKKYKWVPETLFEKIVFKVETGGCAVVDEHTFADPEFQQVFTKRRLSVKDNVQFLTYSPANIGYNPYVDESDAENFKCYKHWIRHRKGIRHSISKWRSVLIVDPYNYPAGQYLIDEVIGKTQGGKAHKMSYS